VCRWARARSRIWPTAKTFKLVDSPRLRFRLKAFARDLPSRTHYTHTEYIARFNVREKNSMFVCVCVCVCGRACLFE